MVRAVCRRNRIGYLVLALMFSGLVQAKSWNVQMQASGLSVFSGSGYFNAGEACAAYVTAINPSFSAGFKWSAGSASVTFQNGMATSGALCTITQGTTGTVKTVNYDVTGSTAGCPPPLVENPTTGICEDPPPPCPEDRIGERVTMNFEAVAGTSIPSFCTANCRYVPVASPNNWAIGQFTCGGTEPAGTCNFFQQTFEIQNSCNVDTPADNPKSQEDLDSGSEERCGVVNGQTVCTSQTEENCGTINGQEVCVPSVPEGNCTIIPGGSYICDSDAPNQPTAPGDPETPATPDVQFSQVDPTTGTADRQVNYYNSTTVGNSSTPVVGSSTPEVGGTSGFGNGSGTGEGEEPFDPTDDDSASGGLDCSAAPSCDGDPIKCALLIQLWRQRCAVDVPSSGDVLEAAGLQDVPTDGSGLNHEAVNFGSVLDQDGLGLSRSCPADVTMSLASFGNPVIPLSQYCSLFETVGTLLMMAAWLAAIRIVVGGL